jgi:streptogramin lyase
VIDPKTEKVTVHIPPSNMSQIDGPVTLDYDGTGGIWAGTLDGVLRFDPADERFVEFKSLTPKTAAGGQGATYGIAGDRDGNVWWTQMAFDIIAKSDIKTGKSLEWKLPPVKEEMAIATPADLKFYDTYAPRDIGTPFPWSQGPRRIGIDRAAGVLWVANSWGGSLTRVDTKSGDMSFVPFPNPTAHQPYATIVDKSHNVWAPMWTTDQIAKYDPTAAQVDGVRPADARDGSAPRLAARSAGRQARSGVLLSALEQGGGDDVPQRRRPRRTQTAGAIAGRCFP